MHEETASWDGSCSCDKRLSAEKRRDVVLASSLPPPLPPGKRKIQLWPQKKKPSDRQGGGRSINTSRTAVTVLTKELDVVSKEQLKCLRSTESSPGNQTDTEGMRGTWGNRNHGWSIQNKQCPTLRGLWKEFLEEIRANGKQDKCGACLPKVGCANDLRTDVPAGGKAADLIPAASHNVFPTPPAWEVVPGGRDHDLRARFVKMAKP